MSESRNQRGLGLGLGVGQGRKGWGWGLLGLMMLSSAAMAQKPLTLQDAIAMGQANGTAAAAARAARDEARYADDAFNARLLPQLILSGQPAQLNHGINPITQPDGSTQFIGQSQNTSSLQLGFQQALPLTGGTITVGSGISRQDQFGSNNATLYQSSPLLVSLSQSLFTPRLIVWTERQQALRATTAERGYLEAREDVASAVAAAFFNLYAQQMTLANAASNAAVNDTLYTLNKGRFEVGKIGENDLLKSELQLLKARSSMEDAKLNRERAEAALRRMINYPVNEALTIVTPDEIPTVDANPDTAVAQALKNSSVIQQSALNQVNSDLGVVQAKSRNRFTTTINASVGFNQTAQAFGQSYQSPLGKQSLTIGVNMPVFQWGAGHSEVAAAMADVQQTQANTKQARDQLIENARFAALQLQQAQRTIIVNAKADTVAEKQFDVARNRYVIGKINNTDLYQAQNDKDGAIIAYVQSLQNYWTAFYQLRRITLYDFEKKAPLVDR